MFFRLLKEGFIFAFNSIIVNKLRTFLSLFGITIGIFSIISVFTVLDWLEKSIHDSISSLGENVIYVHKIPWALNMDLPWYNIVKRPVVSKDDYTALLNRSTKTASACFSVAQTEQIKFRKNLAQDSYVSAVTHEFENIRSFELENGRYFTPEESASGKNVAIVGAVLAERLFEK
ncbi:MAG: ABC transporter permease, partial [Bacteroidales bacterium]|nr:ABC transporter permease [Bacteroidales bacterium]